MKSPTRFYFLFLSIALFYSFTVLGANTGFKPEDFMFKSIDRQNNVGKVVGFYNHEGYVLDLETAHANYAKLQEIDSKYYCITAGPNARHASAAGETNAISAVLEWAAYPRLFDGAPRIGLQIVAAENEAGEAAANYLFHIATGLVHKYQTTLETDMASKVRMSINVRYKDAEKAVGRAIASIISGLSEAFTNTPYGFHATADELRAFASKAPLDSIVLTDVKDPETLSRGYEIFTQLQTKGLKLTPDGYKASFLQGPDKLTVKHATLKTGPDKVVGVVGGAYIAFLRGQEFDLDTLVVAEGARRQGIGLELLRNTASACVANGYELFVESGKDRETEQYYTKKGSMVLDSTNYRWKDINALSISLGTNRGWVAETISSLGL